MMQFLIAAPRSGSGKTTVTCAVLTALQRRGTDPCAFKCGPDYIDPMFHRSALGVESHNLDLYLSAPDTVRTLYARYAAGHGAAVCEGAMGFYDGQGLTTRASAWELADTLALPVLLVVAAIGIGREAEGMALSEVVAQLVPGSIYLACATGFLALTCTMGLAVATAVSREGARHDMRRIYPVTGKAQLGAKLLMGMTFNLASALVSAVALWVLLPGMWLETLGALAVSQVFSLLWCLMSLLLDVYHPKLKWKTETEAVKQSMNAMVSMFGGMILIAALVGAAALLILWGWPISAALGADVLLLVLLDAALWMVLSRKASVTYCLREYSK